MKLYTVNEIKGVECFTYLYGREDGYVIEDKQGMRINLSLMSLEKMILSEIVALNMMMDLLKPKIDAVTNRMRELKTKFNPEDSPSIIHVYSQANSSKEVHMYDLIGSHVQSFSSVSAAESYLNASAGSSIYKAASGKRKVAYGYRWSYEKKRRL